LHGLPVSLVMLQLGALAILADYYSRAVSNGLTVLCTMSFVIWLAELLWARPRFLVPPVWRD
jgi:hypothetical protein